MESVDAVVIGAGVVGLAVGRMLARQGRETLVLESEAAIGTVTSARNSEVIHAGLYYPAGSLKARLCVRGNELLYAHCASHGVAHRRCGKLIVATDQAQHDALAQIEAQAAANGVDVMPLDVDAAHRLEPALRCTSALLSTSTGIVDSHALMLSLQGGLESAGGDVALLAPVESIDCDSGQLLVHVAGAAPMTLAARVVVNAAGLSAPALAARSRGLEARHVPAAWFAKGSYYALSGRAPFTRLIYPVPEPGGLGVHLTLDLGGQARFGPDVEWIEPGPNGTLDYRVDPRRADAFYAQIRRYWPALPDAGLSPAYSGVRPKVAGPGEPAADFVVQGPQVHGVAGLVNLFGIESPGLTACLAIAEHVATLLDA